MKQFIYYIITKTNEEFITITRSEAIEKINNHYKDTAFYSPITISQLDRLVANGKSSIYIENITKHAITDYYKTQIDNFILHDKKQRTDEARKKSINRLVNRLYWSGEKRVLEKPITEPIKECIIINIGGEDEITETEVKRTEVINDDIDDIINEENEIETPHIDICEAEVENENSNMIVPYQKPKKKKKHKNKIPQSKDTIKHNRRISKQTLKRKTI